MSVDVSPYVFLQVVVGSHAFGLSTPESDEDRRGIYLPPAAWHWSLRKPPEQVESIADGIDTIDWEIEKFLTQALKGNPTILETLWSPLVLHADDLGRELIGMRRAFLSRRILQTYSGYAANQFRLMERKVRAGEPFRAKHAMHLIRLLHSGIHAARTGELLVNVGGHRAELLAIRCGERTWDEIAARRAELDAELLVAFDKCCLQAEPETDRADDFLVRARASAVRRP
jgi:predicted nucleotidyltransferase